MLLPILLVELNRLWNQKSTTAGRLVAYLEFYLDRSQHKIPGWQLVEGHKRPLLAAKRTSARRSGTADVGRKHFFGAILSFRASTDFEAPDFCVRLLVQFLQALGRGAARCGDGR
jgi:hypothetical protein